MIPTSCIPYNVGPEAWDDPESPAPRSVWAWLWGLITAAAA